MNEGELIAAQLKHTIDLLQGEIQTLKVQQAHEKELYEHRITALEKAESDHEARIRILAESSTRYKVTSGLTSGGAGLISLIALGRTIAIGF